MGAAITGDYAIAAWSNILMWPAKQAPHCIFFPLSSSLRLLTMSTDKYGWEAAIALLTTAMIMTCVLRFIDGKYLRYVVLV